MTTAHGRIKPGTVCYQDHSFFCWPNTPGGKTDVDQRFIFTLEKSGKVEAAADGFGFGVSGTPKGKYGNGSITVYSPRNQNDS